MKITTDIHKVPTKDKIKIELNGVMLKDKKVVATDAHKLVELDTESDINALIPREYLKKGDTIGKADDGRITITRKDGSILYPETSSTKTYPKYQDLIKDAQERKNKEAYINRQYLIELLQAIPDEYITLKIAEENPETKAVYIEGEKSRGLLMPRLK